MDLLIKSQDTWVQENRDELLRKAASCGAFNCVRKLLPLCSGEGLHHAFVIAVTATKIDASNPLLDHSKTIAAFESFFAEQYIERRRVAHETKLLKEEVDRLKIVLRPRMELILNLVRARAANMGLPTMEGYRATLDTMALLKHFLPKPRSALPNPRDSPRHPRGEDGSPMTSAQARASVEAGSGGASQYDAVASSRCEADIRHLCLFLSKQENQVKVDASAPAHGAVAAYDQTVIMAEANPVELDIERFANVQKALAADVDFNNRNFCEVHMYPEVEENPTVIFNIIKADRSHCRVCARSCCQHCIRRWHVPEKYQLDLTPKARKKLKNYKVCHVCIGRYSTAASAAADGKGKAVVVHAESDFAEIRQRLLGGDRKFIRSFRGAAMPVGKMGGKSREILMRTYDKQFYLKTLSVAERKMLAGEGTFLRDYKAHVLTYDRSLLTRYLGVFSVGRTEVVVMQNCLPLAHAKDRGSAFDEQWVFDLKGSTNNRANPGERVQKDLDFMQLFSSQKQFPVFEREDLLQLRRKIAADVMLLRKHNIMDYSLLVGFYAAQLGTPHERRWGKGVCRITCRIEGKAYTVCLAIVDLLQRYNSLKKIEHALKIFKHNISCVDAETYYKRFLTFLNNALLRHHQDL